ncbi:lipocalin family protein [candidate division KSB1 bacterium]|nr:lipocalin family protein [candidate division KSB1 bacterium]
MFWNCFNILIIPAILLIPGFLYAQEGQERPQLQTVSSVDLKRYTGLWYEVAKIPNSFQRQCACGTTAEYQLRDDGRLTVINSCVKKDGSVSRASGIARVIDDQTRAKLKVSFVSILGIRLFWGDYWIIGLDADYDWAIVGTPSRKYGWILSRSAQLSDTVLDSIYTLLGENGYDPTDFVMTEPCSPEGN